MKEERKNITLPLGHVSMSETLGAYYIDMRPAAVHYTENLYGGDFDDRWFNHALALHELGRDHEASQVLAHSIHQMSDADCKEQAGDLLVEFSIGPLGVFKGGEGTDWSKVIQTLLELRKSGLESDFLKFCLGSAQYSAGNVEDAVATFETIEKRIENAKVHRRFILTRAWSYYRVGRIEDVISSIAEATDEDWSAEERDEADRLVQLVRRDQRVS